MSTQKKSTAKKPKTTKVAQVDTPVEAARARVHAVKAALKQARKELKKAKHAAKTARKTLKKAASHSTKKVIGKKVVKKPSKPIKVVLVTTP